MSEGGREEGRGNAPKSRPKNGAVERRANGLSCTAGGDHGGTVVYARLGPSLYSLPNVSFPQHFFSSTSPNC